MVMDFRIVMKKASIGLLILVALFCLAVFPAHAEAAGIEFWEEDSPAMQSIVAFVEASVDENSEGYIPKADRVAVFDNDGTLYGERFPTYFNDWLYIQRALHDENYEAPEELKAFAQAWEDKVLRGITILDFDAKERELGPKLYEGLTPDEYDEVVRRFKQLPVWGFDGMTYGEAFFQPMVSLVKYLYDHDYTIYIVSATYRDAVRVLTEGTLDEYIPRDHVIGTDLLYVASGDTDQDSMFYELKPEDELVIAGRLFIKNQKTNKATMIQQEIGRMPVLAFGNSTGDFSMATYTLQNKKYGGRAYMLLCDDTDRDYGSPETAASFKKKCDANGFYTVSMRDEFTTIYGDGVKMTDPAQPELDATLFPSWAPDSASLRALVDFVSASTDPSSPSYLDPADRVATFDMDGTILCEKAPIYFDYCLTMYRVLDDPTFDATPVERDAMQQIRDHAYATGEKFKPSTVTKRDLVASAFAGMTPKEFRAYSADYAEHTSVIGFDGMTYAQSFYKPMLEIIEYLKANDFDVWIVSACEREVARALVEARGIPLDHVIATDVPYVASGKGDEAANKYNMGKDEEILLGAPLDAVSCEESNKPAAIAREIGRRPVLAFGNSSGDYSMLNYAEGNPEHAGMAFLVVCDDTLREYGSAEKAAEYYSIAEEQGWTTFSMANDWTTIYGDGVEKTELPGAAEALPKAA